MPRHTQPRELAELKGATRHDPQRYKGEIPKNASPLGDIPAHLSPHAKAVWFELDSYALPGVLTASDRLVMETLATLVADFRKAPSEFPTARIQAMLSCMGRLGMSPADRQKLGTEKPKEGNPFDAF